MTPLISSMTPLISNVILGVDIQPKAPDFANKFTVIISWFLWGCTSLCVLGIAIIGTMLAVSVKNGSGGDQAARLGMAAAGVVIVGISSQIVNALL